MHTFILSEHGEQRARERVGWNRKAAQRMLDRVFFEGIDDRNAPKPLQKFLAEKIENQGHATGKVYAEQLFIFAPTGHLQEFELVTVYPIPQALRKYSHHGPKRNR